MLMLLTTTTFAKSKDSIEPFAFLKNVPGRWTGFGKVEIKSGPSESISCIMTFFVLKQDTHVRHNFRCKSQSYGIDGKVDLIVDGNKVSGKLRELKYEVEWPLAGTISGSKMRLIRTDEKRDEFYFESDKCNLHISFTPSEKTASVKQITVDSRKC